MCARICVLSSVCFYLLIFGLICLHRRLGGRGRIVPQKTKRVKGMAWIVSQATEFSEVGRVHHPFLPLLHGPVRPIRWWQAMVHLAQLRLQHQLARSQAICIFWNTGSISEQDCKYYSTTSSWLLPRMPSCQTAFWVQWEGLLILVVGSGWSTVLYSLQLQCFGMEHIRRTAATIHNTIYVLYNTILRHPLAHGRRYNSHERLLTIAWFLS